MGVRRVFAIAAITAGLALGSTVATSAVIGGPSAEAATVKFSCSGPMCAWKDINLGNKIYTGRNNMCVVVDDLRKLKINDMISSLVNVRTNQTHYYWKDINRKGARLTARPMTGYTDLRAVGFNDTISSFQYQ